MASKKKFLTSAVALGTAAALALGGTYAWQSINQRALNESSDIVNPGGRLHDDFNGTDKNVYVENFADDNIFARVRLEEFFEIVLNAGTPGEKSVPMIGTKTQRLDDDDQPMMTDSGNPIYDYTYVTFTNYQSGFETDAGNVGDDSWWTWSTGGDTVFMPTFNKNKDSLKADINGEYRFDTGVITDKDIDGGQYTAMATYEEEDTKTAYAIYDIDSNKLDEIAQQDLAALIESGTVPEAYQSNVKLLEETHTAKAAPAASLISMADWLEAVETNGYVEGYDTCWVYDTDGWVYWSAPIASGEATGLLLDGIELKQTMDDSWYYAINVVAQFVTANDVGKVNGTGFYDTENGTVPSENAEILLETIGVDMSAAAEGPTDPDGPADPGEAATISLALYDAEGAAVTGSTLKANSTYDIVGTLNTQSGDFVIYDSRDGQTSDEKVSIASCAPYTVAYDTGDDSYNTVNEQGQLVTGDKDTFNYAKISEGQYKDLTLHIAASDVKVYETAADEGDPVETYDSLSSSWNYYPEGGEVYQWKSGQDVIYASPNADNTVDTWSVVDGNEQPISAESLTYELTGNNDENTTLAYQDGKIVLTIGDNETSSDMVMIAKDGNGKAERDVFVKYRGTLLAGDTVLNVDGYNESVTILSSPDATKSYTLTYKDFWGNEVSDATFYIAYRGLIDYGSSIVGNMLMLGVGEKGFLGIAVCGGMPDYPDEEILYYFTPVEEQPEVPAITIKINGGEPHTYNNGDEVQDFALSVGDTLEISCSDSRFDHWWFNKSGLDAPDEGNTITFNTVSTCTFVIQAQDENDSSICTIWLIISES